MDKKECVGKKQIKMKFPVITFTILHVNLLSANVVHA